MKYVISFIYGLKSNSSSNDLKFNGTNVAMIQEKCEKVIDNNDLKFYGTGDDDQEKVLMVLIMIDELKENMSEEDDKRIKD